MFLRFKIKDLSLFILSICFIGSCQSIGNKENKTVKKVQTTQEHFLKNLPEPKGYITDYENIFSDREVTFLDSLIDDFEKRTTIQIAVVTFNTMMTTVDSLAALTLQIANYWGGGQKEKDNGIVIGISAGLKTMRIQNGNGIERILTDEETQKIVDSAFIPAFREGNYFKGTHKGLITLMNFLEERNK